MPKRRQTPTVSGPARGRGTENLPDPVPKGPARAKELAFLGLKPSASDAQVHRAIEKLKTPRFEKYYDSFIAPCERPPTREVRYVDAKTYARIRRWQNDPDYGQVPYEAVNEGGDPEDIDAETQPRRHLDPDFDELHTEVVERNTIRVPVVSKRRGKPILTSKVVGPRRMPFRVAVPLRDDPKYRAHVRRMNSLLDEADGFSQVFDELDRAVNPGKRKRSQLPSPLRYYTYDAFLPAPYFRRFQRQTRSLRDAKRQTPSLRDAKRPQQVERVIARLTTHPDRRGRSTRRTTTTDPAVVKALRADAPKVRRQVNEIVAALKSDNADSARLLFRDLLTDLSPADQRFGQEFFRYDEDRSLGFKLVTRPDYLVKWILGKRHGVPIRRVHTLLGRRS